jgi:DNA-binding transcriptional LysR family regulator
MLDVRKLRMLAELERLGTVGAVADELSMTGPAVSMQLAALGRELGLPLTERRGRRVALTPAGRLLARHGRDVVDLLAVAETEARALREGATGTYRVAAFPAAARAIVPAAWRLLADGAPDVRLRVTECEPAAGLAAVEAGEADLAMTHAYSTMPAPDAPTLVVRPAGAEPVLLAVSAAAPGGVPGSVPAAAPGGVPGSSSAEAPGARRAVGPAAMPTVGPVAGPAGPADLAAYAAAGWVVPPPGLACREMVERACGLAGFAPRVVAEAADADAQLALVAAGAGVALVPRLGTRGAPEGVTLLELRAPVTRRLFTVTRRSSSADAGLATVTWALRAAARTALAAA